MIKKLSGILFSIFIMTFFIDDVGATSLNNDGVFVNLNNVQMTESEKNNLLSLGFTEQQIDFMNIEEFNNNKDLDGIVVAQATKYYKTTISYNNSASSTFSLNNDPIVLNEEITEEEYNNLPDNQIFSGGLSTNGYYQGVTETNGKKLVTSIIYIPEYNRYRLKADLNWKKMPINRSYDLLTIGFDYLVSGIPNTRYFSQFWTYDNICKQASLYQTSSDASWKTTQSGYGVSFKLPSDSSCTTPPAVTPIKVPVVQLGSYMYFDINKLTSPINTINAYGDYAHAIKSVSIETSLGFSFDSGFGITFTPQVKTSYDEMNTAQAYLDNINW